MQIQKVGIENSKNSTLTKSQVNFGWYYKMHSDITEFALKESVEFDFLEKLLLSVRKPDKDEFFLFGEKHFYSKDSKMKSYFDFNGHRNARAVFNKHIDELLDFTYGLNNEMLVDLIGRPLHFIQDITQPNHIETGSLFKKIRDAINPHHKFEMEAYDVQQSLYENYNRVNLVSNNYRDLFDETVEISMQNEFPTRNNHNEWESIAQKSIDLAVSATDKFVEIFKSLNKM